MREFPVVPGLYDLDALGRSLPTGKRYSRLKGLIRQIKAAGSAHADLRLALTQVDLAARLEVSAGLLKPALHRSDQLDAVGAITSWALILYVRATHSSSKTRKTDSIIEKLNSEERVMHKLLTDLRDDAFAHFGTGPRVDAPWSKDAVVFRTSDRQNCAVYTPPYRVAFSKEIGDALKHMTVRAKEIIGELRNRRISKFYEEWTNVWSPDLPNRLSNLPFDAHAFYGDAPHDHLLRSMMSEDSDHEDGEVFYRPPSNAFLGGDEDPSP